MRTLLSPAEEVYLGLGSNLGESAELLSSAAREIARFLDDARLSSLYATRPRDDEKQPLFVNAALKGYCSEDPLELLARLQEIELSHGRKRDPERPKGPRSLDIDILLFGRRVLNLPKLKIPHPRMTDRKFVLVPMLELDPLLTEPGTGRLYAEYAAALEEQGIYFLSLKDYSNSLAWEG